VIVEDGGRQRMSDYDHESKFNYMVSNNDEAQMMAMFLGLLLSKTGPMLVSPQDVLYYKAAMLIPEVDRDENTGGFVFRLVERPDAS
jgi:hypothetical protein